VRVGKDDREILLPIAVEITLAPDLPPPLDWTIVAAIALR
jgi:hypothetical protein